MLRRAGRKAPRHQAPKLETPDARIPIRFGNWAFFRELNVCASRKLSELRSDRECPLFILFSNLRGIADAIVTSWKRGGPLGNGRPALVGMSARINGRDSRLAYAPKKEKDGTYE